MGSGSPARSTAVTAAGPARRGYIDADRAWFFGADSCVIRDLAPYAVAPMVRLLGRPDRFTWYCTASACRYRSDPGTVTPVHGNAAIGIGQWGDVIGRVEVAYRPWAGTVEASMTAYGSTGSLRSELDDPPLPDRPGQGEGDRRVRPDAAGPDRRRVPGEARRRRHDGAGDHRRPPVRGRRDRAGGSGVSTRAFDHWWAEAVRPRVLIARLIPRAGRPLVAGLLLVNVVLGVAPVAFVVASSIVIGSVPDAVAGGVGSAVWDRLIVTFLVASAIFVLQQALAPVQVALGELMRRRVDGYVHQRIMTVALAGAGIAPMEDQDALDAMKEAGRGIDGSRRPRGRPAPACSRSSPGTPAWPGSRCSSASRSRGSPRRRSPRPSWCSATATAAGCAGTRPSGARRSRPSGTRSTCATSACAPKRRRSCGCSA